MTSQYQRMGFAAASCAASLAVAQQQPAIPKAAPVARLEQVLQQLGATRNDPSFDATIDIDSNGIIDKTDVFQLLRGSTPLQSPSLDVDRQLASLTLATTYVNEQSVRLSLTTKRDVVTKIIVVGQVDTTQVPFESNSFAGDGATTVAIDAPVGGKAFFLASSSSASLDLRFSRPELATAPAFFEVITGLEVMESGNSPVEPASLQIDPAFAIFDLTSDNKFDGADVAEFLRLFTEGSPRADLDRDGMLSQLDLLPVFKRVQGDKTTILDAAKLPSREPLASAEGKPRTSVASVEIELTSATWAQRVGVHADDIKKLTKSSEDESSRREMMLKIGNVALSSRVYDRAAAAFGLCLQSSVDELERAELLLALGTSLLPLSDQSFGFTVDDSGRISLTSWLEDEAPVQSRIEHGWLVYCQAVEATRSVTSSNAKALIGRGMAEVAVGRCDDAVQTWMKVMDICPDCPEAIGATQRILAVASLTKNLSALNQLSVYASDRQLEEAHRSWLLEQIRQTQAKISK